MRFDEFVEINPKVNIDKGEEYPFVEMGAVVPTRRYVQAKKSREFGGGGSKFRVGDTLFAQITPCLENGKIAQFVDEENQLGFGSTEFIVFRAKPGISDPSFVYYLARTNTIRGPAEKSMSGASGRQRADAEVIRKIEVDVPSLDVQQKIASILSAYDDLIENNLRRTKILEEIAQTLYREWFVKFRFPGHQKVKMVNSPLGKIPEGWEVSTVGDNITVVPRKNKIKTDDYLTEGVMPVIDQGKDFIAGYIDDTSLAYDGLLPIIVFGDHTCVLKWVDFRFAVGADGTQLIQPEYPEKLPLRFLFYTLQFVPLEQFGYQRHFKYLKEAKILIPSANLARKFEEVVSFNTDLILNLQRQNLNLRRTRDLLLPKLISGAVDVSELNITIPKEAEI